MVYVCSKCLFAFERLSQTEQCPDCGSENVRIATETEIAEYQHNREEAVKEITLNSPL